MILPELHSYLLCFSLSHVGNLNNPFRTDFLCNNTRKLLILNNTTTSDHAGRRHKTGQQLPLFCLRLIKLSHQKQVVHSSVRALKTCYRGYYHKTEISFASTIIREEKMVRPTRYSVGILPGIFPNHWLHARKAFPAMLPFTGCWLREEE